MHLDLHTHSNASKDSVLKPKTMLKIAKQKNLVIALSDHNNTNNWAAMRQASRELNYPVILGEEIRVFFNGEQPGEIVALFLQEEVQPGEFLEVIDELKRQDAMIIAAHPFAMIKASFVKHLQDLVGKVQAVEVFNSRNYLESCNTKAKEFAEKHNLPFTAGSDAHTPEELGQAFVEVDAGSIEEARKKILKKQSRVFGRLSPAWVHLVSALAKNQWIDDV